MGLGVWPTLDYATTYVTAPPLDMMGYALRMRVEWLRHKPRVGSPPFKT
jgi:hypothetical protein